MADSIKNSVSNSVSNGISSISNNVGSIKNSIADAGASVYNSAVNTISNPIPDGSLANASNEYVRSNSIVAKFAFLILVLIVFIFILNLGINIVGYFMNPTNNPYIVKGTLDGKNPLVISQNPKDANSVSIIRSNNEDKGIEFTWSVWLLLTNNTSDKKYKNIFNKGDSYYNNDAGTGVSLVNNGPGLYLNSLTNNQNTLQVIMDTVNPNGGPSEVNVDGVPFNKWFHVAIRIENKVLDVYVNGTIASRHVMKFVPKQNYNDVNVCQNGGFDGQLSNLQYFSHSLSAVEINSIVMNGPDLKSSKLNSATNSIVPYFLSNAWYTSQQ